MMKKRENDTREPLYKRLKTRGILSRPNLEEKYGPLDQNPTVGCQKHITAQNTYDVSRILKRQKQ